MEGANTGLALAPQLALPISGISRTYFRAPDALPEASVRQGAAIKMKQFIEIPAPYALPWDSGRRAKLTSSSYFRAAVKMKAQVAIH